MDSIKIQLGEEDGELDRSVSFLPAMGTTVKRMNVSGTEEWAVCGIVDTSGHAFFKCRDVEEE